MISKLKVDNFQPHRGAALNFVDGVNVIVGSSDSGKSSLTRALVWALTNKPQGFGFRSSFAGKEDVTSVEVWFHNDTVFLIRSRDENENKYTYDLGKSAGELEALRGDVPVEILHLTNMVSYNVQSQHDRYFLLENTSGEVARMLNDLVGLGVIDKTTANIEDITRKAKSKWAQSEERVVELQRELKEFEELSQIEKLVVVLETTLQERDLKRQERKELSTSALKLQELDEEIRLCNVRLELEKESKEFFKESSLMAGEVKDRNYLHNKKERLLEIDEDIEDIDNEIASSSELDKLVVEIQTYKKEVATRNELESLFDKLDILDADVTHFTDDLIALGTQLGSALREAGSCPLCSSKIDSETMIKIVEELT